MTITDPISDLLTRIRNANLKRQATVDAPHSQFKVDLLNIIQKEGYIESFTINDGKIKGQKIITINLKYYDQQPVITHIKRISKPGQRIYQSSKNLPKILNGLGIAVVSTSKGLLTSYAAKAQKLGGEVICEIY